MENNAKMQRKKCEFPGIRYWFAVAGFFGFIVNHTIQTSFNVAIVAMVNSTAVYHAKDNTSTSNECMPPAMNFNSSKWTQEPNKEGEFLWTPQEQGAILGAFYYGYCILQIPGGRMADMYSAKWVFGLGTFIPALLTLLTPSAARLHVGCLVALRALEGLLQGVTFPSINTMMSHWFQKFERGSLIGFMYGGIPMGTLIGMTATGFLCDSDLFGGWPAAFYVAGACGCVWFLLWCLFITDTPHTHPFITEKELKYILSNQREDIKAELPPFPWCKVMTSVPFWALIIGHVGGSWGYFLMLNDLPTFFATILQFDISKNGFLSSLPYLLKAIVVISVGFICDTLMRKGIATVGFIRKFCTVLSHVVAAFILVGVCLAGCDVTLNVTFLMCFVILYGVSTCGDALTPFDMSPEYAGTIVGISNTIASVTGFVTPLMVGALTEKRQTLAQWQIVFGISAAIQAVSGLIFIFFSSAEKQNWLTEERKINKHKEQMNTEVFKESSSWI